MLSTNSPINMALQRAKSQADCYALKRTLESIDTLSLRLASFEPLLDILHKPGLQDAVDGVRRSYEFDMAMVNYKLACAEHLAEKLNEKSWWFGEGTYPDIMVRVLGNEADAIVRDGRKRYIIIPDSPEPGDKEHPKYSTIKNTPRALPRRAIDNPTGIGAFVALASGITLYNTIYGKGDLRIGLIKSAIEGGTLFLALGAMLVMERKGMGPRFYPGQFSDSWDYFRDVEEAWKDMQNTLSIIEQMFRWDSTLPVGPQR